jgi:hypothetical protein
MNYSIQQEMTVQNEKDNKNLLILRIPTTMPRIQTGVVSVILPKGFITLNTSLSAKMTQKLIYNDTLHLTVLPIFAEQLYPSSKVA